MKKRRKKQMMDILLNGLYVIMGLTGVGLLVPMIVVLIKSLKRSYGERLLYLLEDDPEKIQAEMNEIKKTGELDAYRWTMTKAEYLGFFSFIAVAILFFVLLFAPFYKISLDLFGESLGSVNFSFFEEISGAFQDHKGKSFDSLQFLSMAIMVFMFITILFSILLPLKSYRFLFDKDYALLMYYRNIKHSAKKRREYKGEYLVCAISAMLTMGFYIAYIIVARAQVKSATSLDEMFQSRFVLMGNPWGIAIIFIILAGLAIAGLVASAIMKRKLIQNIIKSSNEFKTNEEETALSPKINL